MKLKTAANWQLAITFILYIAFSPLRIFFVVIDVIDDKLYCLEANFLWWLGRKLLLRTDEFKSGMFKNPKVKEEWTALQVWKQLKREQPDCDKN